MRGLIYIITARSRHYPSRFMTRERQREAGGEVAKDLPYD